MSQDLNADQQSCAGWIARFLKARGIDRIFGLQGGHIQPMWDHVARLGHPHHRCARRGRRGSHGARSRRADRRLRRRHGHRGSRRHQHRHRDGERVAGPRAGAADRRLHVASAGQYGPAAGHSSRRHSASGDARVAHLARCGSSHPRTRRSGGARHGRFRRARPGLHGNSDRRAAHQGCAATRAR